ncbi:MAG: DUF202 domain-containing protein [Candidatus Aenigmarchaeota archaeon]|nr:DUF202 domain-containing protein [Candidatus Aenigmarchaeota archaeon]
MKEKHIIRDYLAQYRTDLANERTLLAYWRTSFSLFVLGIFLVKFLPSAHFIIFGVIAIALGVLLFFYGIMRFLDYKKKINHIWDNGSD